jgi:hypothetical protein
MTNLKGLGRAIREWYAAQDRRGRVLVTTALVLALLQVIRFGWAAASGFAEDLDQRIEIREMEYRNLTRMASGGAEYERMTERILRFREGLVRERFVAAATPALAEAMFQNILNDLVERHQITVVSLRMLPRLERDGVVLLRLGINARGEIGAIRDFLAAVEHNPRMLFCEEVEIRHISRQERRFFNFNAQLAAVSES